MTIQQFARHLEHEGNPSPLLEALQALRACELDRLRSPREGLFAGWVVWEEGVVETPQTLATRPELRN